MFKEHKALEQSGDSDRQLVEVQQRTIDYLMRQVEQLLKDKESLTVRLAVTNAAIGRALESYRSRAKGAN